MDVGTFLFMLTLSYGFGVFWYSLLSGRLYDTWWRVLAYPFALIALGEIAVAWGPTFGGIHYITAFVAALVGTVIDWIIAAFRHPVEAREMLPAGGGLFGRKAAA